MEKYNFRNFDVIVDMLQREQERLCLLITEMEKSLKNAPAGRLRLDKRKNQMQWYRVTAKTTEHGEYIPLANIRLARTLAQKEYVRKLLSEIQPLVKATSKFLNVFSPEQLPNVFLSLNPSRRLLVEPICVPDELFVAQWKAEKYRNKGFAGENSELFTSRGECVRSKSEVIIADVLNQYGIPYKYEKPIVLSLKKKTLEIYPDFTCLNVRLRKEIIWEHFGRMDDVEYSIKVVKKLDSYEKNGYFLGDRLICSMESEESPFDAKKAERLVKKYLL